MTQVVPVHSPRRGPTRRSFLATPLIATAGLALSGWRGRAIAASTERVTVYGMPATPSVVLARAVATLPADLGITFDIYRTADQVRSGLVSGAVNLVALPTYSAANLANRGAGLGLVNVLTWGLLYGVARDPAITRIEDLVGKTVLVAQRHDAPDLLLRLALRGAGLNPDRDVNLSYAATSAELVPLFLSGRGDVAILPEPAASTALIKGRQAGQMLTRALDITAIRGQQTGTAPRIPQAGLCVSERLRAARPDLITALAAACHDAARWIAAEPAEAAKLGAEWLGLPAPIVAASLPEFRLDVVDAGAARPDLERYFTDLMSLSPDIIGGRLPDPAFYWAP
jgi:NitT/TauT family transport system substrate-binding protein